MESVAFLTLDQVIKLHAQLIDRYGGMHGTRDTGLLQSAIAMPQMQYGDDYLHDDVYTMAGAYLYHLVQNHPFFDGNKRIGAASAIVFLAINEIEIDNDEEGLVDITLRVAQGQLDKAAIADFFKKLAH